MSLLSLSPPTLLFFLECPAGSCHMLEKDPPISARLVLTYIARAEPRVG